MISLFAFSGTTLGEAMKDLLTLSGSPRNVRQREISS